MSSPLPSSSPQGTVLIVDDKVNDRLNDLLTISIFQQERISRLSPTLSLPVSA